MKRKGKGTTYSVRVTHNASGRSVSFTVAPYWTSTTLDSVVSDFHDFAVRTWSPKLVTRITDRRHARR